MSTPMIVFDMDGVLVDPTHTFRLALVETVRHFTGIEVTQDEIVRIKNEGGYNDDSEIVMLYLRQAGVDVPLDVVRRHGRDLYWGEDADGMIRNERWLAADGLLERLSESYRLGIFTGRGIPSATHSLKRFCPHLSFDPIMTNEQCENLKPAPGGLVNILKQVPDAAMTMVGDNIDDCKAANGAGVRFVGISHPETPRADETSRLFHELGAVAVIDSVNELERYL
jgi:HAD superfamily phosphatase